MSAEEWGRRWFLRDRAVSDQNNQEGGTMAERVRELHVNGASHEIDVEAERSLLGVLRDELDLTGAKYGCGEGRCGACTVLVDGEPTHACIAKVGHVAGKAITTIEGLEGSDGSLHPVQAAFLEVEAFQCGYCTPGMILGAVALLEREPEPDDAAIVDALDGHVCRCGTYTRILKAIHLAAGATAAKGGAR